MKQIYTLNEPIEVIHSAESLFKQIKTFDINYNQENFILICLNVKNKIIASKNLFMGGLNTCIVDLRVLFRFALMNNAAAIIIAHNHPSGDLRPSPEDEAITRKIKKAGDIMQIQLLDSIIFNKEEFWTGMDK